MKQRRFLHILGAALISVQTANGMPDSVLSQTPSIYSGEDALELCTSPANIINGLSSTSKLFVRLLRSIFGAPAILPSSFLTAVFVFLTVRYQIGSTRPLPQAEKDALKHPRQTVSYSLVSQRPQNTVSSATPLNSLLPQIFSTAARILARLLP